MSPPISNQPAPVVAVAAPLPDVAQVAVVAYDPDDARLPKILAAVNSCTMILLSEDDIRKMIQEVRAVKATDVPIQAPLKLKKKENANLKRNIFLTPDGKCRILMTCTKLGDHVVSDVGSFKIIKKQVVVDLDNPDLDPEVEALAVCKKKRVAASNRPWKAVQQDFQTEAEILATFHGQPEIVQTTFFAAESDKLYLGEELCTGGDLFEAIASGQISNLPLVKRLRIARDCAQGLAILHKDRFIYRDLKPDNFLITEDGRIKLTDLGLMCSVDDVAKRSILLGSPHWLAPEAAAAVVSVASSAVIRAITTQANDIFSLGVLFFWILTGKNFPFQKTDKPAEVLKNIQNLTNFKLAATIQAHKKTIPPGMFPLLQKMLKCDPAERIITAAQIVAALDIEIEAAEKAATDS